MTAPFARWRDQYRDRPGQLPTREVLAAHDPATPISVRADVLLQLVVQAENHDAPCGCLAASVSDEACRSTPTAGLPKLPTGTGPFSGSGFAP